MRVSRLYLKNRPHQKKKLKKSSSEIAPSLNDLNPPLEGQ